MVAGSAQTGNAARHTQAGAPEKRGPACLHCCFAAASEMGPWAIRVETRVRAIRSSKELKCDARLAAGAAARGPPGEEEDGVCIKEQSPGAQHPAGK